MPSILIKNGRVIDPANGLDGPFDVLIEGGAIKAVAPSGAVGAGAGRVMDAAGLWVLPGLIDMHVHLREPGQEYKETVESGTRAAAAGGFTAVAAMPNTAPPMDNAAMVRALVAKAKAVGHAKVWPVAAMTQGRAGEVLAEYQDLKEAGAVAVSDDGSWVSQPKVMRRVLDYAAAMGLAALGHTEDQALSAGGALNEGVVATRLGLPGIPAQAEEGAVRRDLGLVELTGRPLHFCHLSTQGAVEAVRQAKGRGLPVTCETAPHYLFLTEEDVGDYDTNAKMNPPLRTAEDREAVRAGLADGTIDALATDHAPHSVLEKEVPFVEAAFGIIGLQTSLPLALELVRGGLITPARLVEVMSLNPARILGLPSGTLTPGRPADVTLVDPGARYAIAPSDSLSLSHNSPFWGRPLQGRAVATIVDGQVKGGPWPPSAL